MEPDAGLLAQLREIARGNINPGLKQQFDRYLALLAKWNRAFNLVSRRLPEEGQRKLVHRALLPALFLPGTRGNLLDVGSGAGLPAIPLTLFRPTWTVTAVESRLQRVNFLREIHRSLQLETLDVTHGRLEDLAPDIRFDAMTVQGIGELEKILIASCERLKPGGRIIIPTAECRVFHPDIAPHKMQIQRFNVTKLVPGWQGAIWVGELLR